ncbi:MAG: ketopantoate reductase family protein [Thermoleophilia bacterium]
MGELIAALDDARLPAQAPPNIDSVIWSKACQAAGAFAVSMLTRRPVAEIMADLALAGAMADLVAETAAVAEAAGHEIHDYPGMLVRSWARDPRHVVLEGMAQRAAEMAAADRTVRVSMLQDLLAGRPLEVEEMCGTLLQEAQARGVPVPRLSFRLQPPRRLQDDRLAGTGRGLTPRARGIRPCLDAHARAESTDVGK